LPWEEKDLRRLMEMKRRKWREGKKRKGEEIFSQPRERKG
jgi:hypothetical protein